MSESWTRLKIKNEITHKPLHDYIIWWNSNVERQSTHIFPWYNLNNLKTGAMSILIIL